MFRIELTTYHVRFNDAWLQAKYGKRTFETYGLADIFRYDHQNAHGATVIVDDHLGYEFS